MHIHIHINIHIHVALETKNGTLETLRWAKRKQETEKNKRDAETVKP